MSDAKRVAVPAGAVQTLVHHYFSDENLKTDSFFHEALSKAAGGWIDVDIIMRCNRIKQLQVAAVDVVKALEGSTQVETKADGDKRSIRRKDGRELPAFEGKQRPGGKNRKAGASHDGGVVLVVEGVPTECHWGSVKAAVDAKLRRQLASSDKPVADGQQTLAFTSRGEGGKVVVVANQHAYAYPLLRRWTDVSDVLDGDKAGKTTEEVDKIARVTLQVHVANGPELEAALATAPKNIVARRRLLAKQAQAKRLRAVEVAGQSFSGVQPLKAKIREIIASRSDKEELHTDGNDYKLILALLKEHHPSKEKGANVDALRVDKATIQGTRCFYMRKSGSTKWDDFSALKCVQAIQDEHTKLDEEASAKEGDAQSAEFDRLSKL